MRIILVAAARPTMIKVAPLLPALAGAGITADVAFTGHRDTARTSEEPGCVHFWGVTVPAPRWFLGIGEGTSAIETGEALVAIERLLKREDPDWVVAVGDHNATLALAIAAAKQGIPVAHVEAGLRCGDLTVPEEVNRVLISRITALHLACDEGSIAHLTAEGVDPERIKLVGSVLAESVIRLAEAIRRRDTASTYGLKRGAYAAASIHCAENVRERGRCEAIIAGLRSLDMPVLLPDANGLRRALAAHGLSVPESVSVVDEVPYPDMLAIVRDAGVVITDSGGVQEEACMLGTPCVTLRSCTERTATVDVGANRLADASEDAIVSAAAAALEGPRRWLTPKRWDKAVSNRIVRALKRGVPSLA